MSEVPAWFERKFNFTLAPAQYPNVRVRLWGTPARLEEMFQGVHREALIAKPEGKWSAQEHAGHLLDLEPLWLSRIEDFFAVSGVLTAADLSNRKTDEAGHNHRALSGILTDFRAARRALLARADARQPGSNDRTIEHPRLKQPMRLIDHLYFVAEHDDHHLARICELLRVQGTGRW
ncbi:MAG: DinB family protein [Acidobacteriaceae bacterium]|nr:DinB family protein [Acidobacteriaceae bacterium]